MKYGWKTGGNKFLVFLDCVEKHESKIMNCIIVDDDLLSCKVLESYVSKSSALSLTGIYNDSVSARNAIVRHPEIDLVFLDLKMPEMDGFDFIDSLQNPPNIIIVTSDEHHALKAYDLNVADYLLKPVTYARFCRAIDKIRRYYLRRGESRDNGGEKEIFIKKGSSLEKLKFRDILYIEALENYVTLATSEEKYTIHFTMKAIESQLPPDLFIRVHRSYIVNKAVIQTIRENSLDINIGGTIRSVPVGKSFRDMLLGDINVMAK